MNVKLRPWELSDLDDLVRYANNSKIAANMTNRFPHPYTEKDGQEFIRRFQSNNPVQIFVIEYEGELVGAIGVHPQKDIMAKNAELGYWVAEPFWGKGIATESIRQIVIYAFKTFDINRIFARPFGSNKASQKVLEKSGFQLEARFDKTIFKNGVYQDELIYALRK